MKIKDRIESKNKPPVMTYALDDMVIQAVKAMSENNYGATVIVDTSNKPLGIVTELDFRLCRICKVWVGKAVKSETLDTLSHHTFKVFKHRNIFIRSNGLFFFNHMNTFYVSNGDFTRTGAFKTYFIEPMILFNNIVEIFDLTYLNLLSFGKASLILFKAVRSLPLYLWLPFGVTSQQLLTFTNLLFYYSNKLYDLGLKSSMTYLYFFYDRHFL